MWHFLKTKTRRGEWDCSELKTRTDCSWPVAHQWIRLEITKFDPTSAFCFFFSNVLMCVHTRDKKKVKIIVDAKKTMSFEFSIVWKERRLTRIQSSMIDVAHRYTTVIEHSSHEINPLLGGLLCDPDKTYVWRIQIKNFEISVVKHFIVRSCRM